MCLQNELSVNSSVSAKIEGRTSVPRKISSLVPRLGCLLKNGFRAYAQSILFLFVTVISSNLDLTNKKSANSLQFNSAATIIILILIAPAGFWPRGQNPRRHPRIPRVYTYKEFQNVRK